MTEWHFPGLICEHLNIVEHICVVIAVWFQTTFVSKYIHSHVKLTFTLPVKTWHHPLTGLIIKRTSCLFLQMVSLLLGKGANARAKDKKERQAIHWAAYQGKCGHTLSLIWFQYEKEHIKIREHLGNTFAITCFVILTRVWKGYIMHACILRCARDNFYFLMYWSQYCWQFCDFNKQKVNLIRNKC